MNDAWDTTVPVLQYPRTYKKIYDDIYNKQRKSFTSWVDKISEQFKKDLDWWVSPVPSRNINISNLFNYICILESLKILDRKKKFPKKIIVSSYQLKKIIIQNFKKQNFQVIRNKKP